VPDWDPAIAGTLDEPVPDLWPLWRGAARVPILLVRGGASDVLSAATVLKMRASRPDMPIVTLPDVGHAPSLSEPEAVAAIENFLEGLP
jgi:pimeloyl-ACP methyl ester carboxylesterase